MGQIAAELRHPRALDDEHSHREPRSSGGLGPDDVTPASERSDDLEQVSSRRGLLRLGSLAGVGVVAAACAPAPGSDAASSSTKPFPEVPPATVPATPPAWSSATGMHVARRLTWGATPALAAHIETLGLEPWLNQQINWRSIDDSHIAAMIAPWPRPDMSPSQVNDDKPWRIPQELAAHETIRRVYSNRQLHEVITDFWHDHFNVFAQHTPAQRHLGGMDRDVIRVHALGRFSDMLPAVASHPAMLHYLDQASSRADRGRTPNENFAREVMELHTVGSDGGYEEGDIKAVAHLMSGWSVTDSSGPFTFRSNWHDMGPMAGRTVLGWSAGSSSGEAAGRSFLDHLARHPATARRVCHKLAVRLIGEQVAPDSAVVDRAVAAYNSSGTDISAVVRKLVLSVEFADSAGARVRRPASLLTQMARALQLQWEAPNNPDSFLWQNWNSLEGLGNANHDWPAPNGYPDVNGYWLSVGSLVSRWNLAVWLAYDTVDGMPFDAASTQAWAPNQLWGEWLDAIAERFTGEPWAPDLRDSILAKYEVTADTRFRSWDHYYAAPIITVLLQTAGFQRS